MSRAVQPHNIHDIGPDPARSKDLRAAVVIPVYNRAALLANTLHSLAAQEGGVPEFEVRVVDDGSEEDIKQVVDSVSGLDLHYHHQERHGFGAGRARNLGAAHAAADIVIFLDADCLVPSDFLARHVAWHPPQERTVLIGGRSNPVQGSPDEFVDSRKRLSRRTANLQFGSEVFRSLVSSNVSMPLDLFREVGGFDERFQRWGGEDTELGWRLWQKGAWFLNDEGLAVDHQLAEDSSGGSEGRERSRHLNRGLIASLIPHLFYRKKPPFSIPAVPKVTVILHDVPQGTSHEAWEALLRQPRTDFELIVVADPDSEEPFAGASVGDPRISFAPALDLATDLARGEYICYLNGHGAPGRTLLHESIKRLDIRSHLVTGTVGYALPAEQGRAVRSRNGAADIDTGWKTAMPLCWFIRTREAVKLRSTECDTTDVWARSQDWDLNLHVASAAVRLPGATPTARPEDFTHLPPEGRQVLKDAWGSPRALVSAGFRYVKARRSGTSYQPVTREVKTALRQERERPQARYVGWTGKHNLGDDLMLEKVRDLLSWADIETGGDPLDLLLLGGGTLINRHTYLKWLLDRDSPRVERAVIGTGVASPDFWGVTEDTGRWVRWLSSCSYVGVRGPRSYEILRSWGYEGEMEVSGDTALLVERPEGVDTVEGRIVVAPVWAKGELWGGSDSDVASVLAPAIRHWKNQGYEVFCLASSPEDDGQILQLSADSGGEVLPYVSGYQDPDAAIELLASAEVVIGERLHACVVAAAVGTPFVGIEYRPKLRDFAASVEAEHLVVRTDQLDVDSVLQLAREAIEHGPEAASARVEEYRGRLKAASDRIRHAVTA